MSQAVRKVNYILNKNRNILRRFDVHQNGEIKKIPKDLLQFYGFDFEYHTHIQKVAEDTIHYYCYDYGYKNMNNKYYQLIRKPKKE